MGVRKKYARNSTETFWIMCLQKNLDSIIHMLLTQFATRLSFNDVGMAPMSYIYRCYFAALTELETNLVFYPVTFPETLDRNSQWHLWRVLCINLLIFILQYQTRYTINTCIWSSNYFVVVLLLLSSAFTWCWSDTTGTMWLQHASTCIMYSMWISSRWFIIAS